MIGCAGSLLLFTLSMSSCLESKPSVTQLTKPIDHAEGPVWDARTRLLYYVDIHSGNLHYYDVYTGENDFINLNGELSLVVPTVCNPYEFIVGLNRSVVAVAWPHLRSKSNRTSNNSIVRGNVLTTVDKDKPKNRFNDGKADSSGRLWFGTMGYEDPNGHLDPNAGSLYFITNENIANPKAVVSPVNISNGLAWNRANDKFFYIDTPTNQVREYDYDSVSGNIFNPGVVFDVNDFSQYITGHPDGMTIDIDDNLWIALYDGGAVVKVNPRQKRLLQIVAIPARYTTSVCWGGDNYDILFVTTSRYMLNGEDRKRQSAAGSVFAVRGLNTSGLPSFRANISRTEERGCIKCRRPLHRESTT